MRDTAPGVEATILARLASMSPADRLRMTCQMFDDAKVLAEAGIRAQCPDITPDELRVRMFERLYWADFDAATHQRIVRALRTN